MDGRAVVHLYEALAVRRRVADSPPASLAPVAVALEDARSLVRSKALVRRQRFKSLEDVLARLKVCPVHVRRDDVAVLGAKLTDAPTDLVHVGHAWLLEQEPLDPLGAVGDTHRQHAPAAHARENLLHRAGREDPSLVDHRDRVAYLGQLGEDVRAQEDRLAVGGQLANQRAELDPRASESLPP